MSDHHELLDIVNEDNEVLHQATRGEAHERGLLHRCVLAQLVNSQGEWTLVRQAADRQDAGQWVSPMGGHVNAGESMEDALRREVLEELGIADFTHRFVGKVLYRRTVLGRDENHYFIFYEIYSDAEPVLNEESVEYKKFAKEDLKERIKTHPHEFGDAFFFGARAFYPELFQ